MMDSILKYFQLDFKVYFVLLKDTKKAFDDFKNKNEWSNVFFLYVKIFILKVLFKHTLHWDKTQMSEKVQQAWCMFI